MKMNLYSNESSNPKFNAQRNLSGRTHYVDDDTLKFHRSRVLSSRCTDGGLLFAIVTSDGLNYENTRRGYRFAIFDVFGTILERPTLYEAYRTSAQATKAMWAVLNTIDAKAVTMAGIENARLSLERDLHELALAVERVTTKAKAA